jgi:glycosyltransferase involved in cell wall biosynthesis
MRIVFVYPNAYSLGGIETWLTRVLPGLRRMGHDVALLTRPPVESWDVSSEIVDRLAEHATIHVAGRHWFRGHRSIEPPLQGADALFAANLQAFLVAALVQQHVLPQTPILAGVFGPREYCSKVPLIQRRWGLHLTERLIRHLPAENFMFCTPGMARQTGDCLGRDLSGAPVLPIPVDVERFRPEPDRKVVPGKIVSVARLHPLYDHHDHMIRVIRDLRGAGEEFSYHAYGDGPRRAELEAEVRRLGLEDAVFFHGTVAYAQFGEVVRDAFAFVGTGTALVEAAACGVPSLVAITGHPEPMSHGWIQDVSGNEFGGAAPGHPEYAITERLRWLAARAEGEYRQLEQAARRRAEEFSLPHLLPRFLEILEAAAPFPLPISIADRALGQLDWLLEAVLLNLGAPDGWTQRYVQDQPA